MAQAVDDLTAFLETSAWDEESLLNHIRRTVEGHDRIFGSAVAFLPHMFKSDIEGFAPYFFKTKAGVEFEQLGKESYNYFSKSWFRVPVNLRTPIWTDPYFDEGGGNVPMITTLPVTLTSRKKKTQQSV